MSEASEQPIPDQAPEAKPSASETADRIVRERERSRAKQALQRDIHRESQASNLADTIGAATTQGELEKIQNPSSPEHQSTEKAKPDDKIQKEIVGFFYHDQSRGDYFSPATKIDHPTQWQHDDFMQKLREGTVDTPQFNAMITTGIGVRGTLDADGEPDLVPFATKRVFQDLENNSQGRAVISHFTKGDMDQRENLTPDDILNFYKAHPLPSTFEETDSQEFLNELSKTNRPQKIAEYKKSITRMMRNVYGKRMSQWEQFKLMRDETKSTTTQKEKGLERIPDGVSVEEHFNRVRAENLNARNH